MLARRHSVWAGGMLLLLSVAAAQGIVPDNVHEFPSGGSSLTGAGVSDIGGGQIGWFWRASDNQSISEVLTDPEPEITRALLHIEIPQNTLISSSVEWTVTINNSAAGGFLVAPGFTGEMFWDLNFAPIAAVGGSYEVTMQVVNDVPPMDGAHTLGFTEPYDHSIELIPEPATAMILSIFALAVVRRVRNIRRKAADRDRSNMEVR